MSAIAIVGIGCEYPDARSPRELWENALAQRRAFRRLPAERLDLRDYPETDPRLNLAGYAGQAAVIDRYTFDRVRFQVVGSTRRAVDRSHWLALDCADRALRDAGFPGGAGLPHESTGVILGNTLTGDQSRGLALQLRWPVVRRAAAAALAAHGHADDRADDLLSTLRELFVEPFEAPNEETLAGWLANTIAGRIANHFGLQGGGYIVDGACAASLLSVTTACGALLAGDLDVAIAGGVDLSLDPFELVGFARAGALARRTMRVFDRRANGFWPGEGCGMLVLMRAADAAADHRRTHALIRGWGVSSDGRGGMTRPETAGQLLALRRAYRRAGFAISTVGYFEAHGTGTPVGDAAELRAVETARREAGAGPRTAAIGSIKANIGHTKAAAGVAGLIKAVMAVRERILPPATACDEPHDLLQQPDASLTVLQEPRPWPSGIPARAAVSAMGFGGINTHIIVEGLGPLGDAADIARAADMARAAGASSEPGGRDDGRGWRGWRDGSDGGDEGSRGDRVERNARVEKLESFRSVESFRPVESVGSVKAVESAEMSGPIELIESIGAIGSIGSIDQAEGVESRESREPVEAIGAADGNGAAGAGGSVGAIDTAASIDREDDVSEPYRAPLQARVSRWAATPQHAELLVWSADSADDLRRRVGDAAARIAACSESELTDLAIALQRASPADRPRGHACAAVVASTPAEAAMRCAALADAIAAGGEDDRAPSVDAASGVYWSRGQTADRRCRVGLLFPGHGAPAARSAGAWERRFERVAAMYRAAARAMPDEDDRMTRVAQPAIVLASCAALDALARCGIEGDVAVGHSLGELTAWHWAGAMDRDTLLTVVAARAAAMQEEAAAGAMAVIAASPPALRGIIEASGVTCAGFNAQAQTAISGSSAAIERALALAAAAGLAGRRLAVGYAFHSPAMRTAAARFAGELRAVDFQMPQAGRRVCSTVRGGDVAAAGDLRDLLVDQFTQPVRFAEALRAADPVDLWIEAGPGRVLSGLARESTRAPIVSLDVGGAQGVAGWLHAVAAAFVLGLPVRLVAVAEGRFSRPFDLQRPRQFFDNPCEAVARGPAGALAPLDRDGASFLHAAASPGDVSPAAARQAASALDRGAGAEGVPPDEGARPAVRAAGAGRADQGARRQALPLSSPLPSSSSPLPSPPALLSASSSAAASSALSPPQSSQQAPASTHSASDGSVASPQMPVDTVDVARRVAAARAELPLEIVRADQRLLADLHFNSLSIGLLAADIAQALGVPPLANPTEFANATLGELADAFRDARPAAAASVGHGAVAGLASWVRPFALRWEPHPLPASEHRRSSSQLRPVAVPMQRPTPTSMPTSMSAPSAAARGTDVNADSPANSAANNAVNAAVNVAHARASHGLETRDEEAVRITGTPRTPVHAAAIRALTQAGGGHLIIAAPPLVSAAPIAVTAAAATANAMKAVETESAQPATGARIQADTATFGDAFSGASTATLDAFRALARQAEPARIVVLHDAAAPLGALARTLHVEAPQHQMLLASVDDDCPNPEASLRAEIAALDGFADVRLTARGRLEARMMLLRPAIDAAWPLTRGDVVIVTGGAAGITAECARALAQATGARLALLGRSAADADAVRAWRERCERAGVTTRYECIDLLDAAAVAETVDRIRDTWGEIRGLLHGAAINDPCRLAAMSDELFARTVDTKVRAARHLLAALDGSRLALVVAFGSIIARTGLDGEAHYGAANEQLAQLIADTAARTQATGGRWLTIEWSVWAGLGMGERLGRIAALERDGVAAITLDQGIAAFLDLVRARDLPSSVIVTSRVRAGDTLRLAMPDLPPRRFLERLRVFVPGVEMVADAALTMSSDPYLADHVLDGAVIVPGVMGLEAMAQAAEALSGAAARATAFTFTDLAFDAPILVPADGRVTVRTLALADDGRGDVVVALRASTTGFARDHFRARVRIAVPPAVESSLSEDSPALPSARSRVASVGSVAQALHAGHGAHDVDHADHADYADHAHHANGAPDTRDADAPHAAHGIASATPIAHTQASASAIDAAPLYGPIFFQGPRFQAVRSYQRLHAREAIAQIAAPGDREIAASHDDTNHRAAANAGTAVTGTAATAGAVTVSASTASAASVASASSAAWFAAYLPQTLLLGYPGLRDAGIHAVQACIPHARLVPVAAARVWIRTPLPPGPRTVHARERSQDGPRFVYDLEIRDAHGAICEVWTGLELHNVQPLTPAEGWPVAVAAPLAERLLDRAPLALTLRATQNGHRAGAELLGTLAASGDAAGQTVTHATHAASTSLRRDVLHRPDGRPEIDGGGASIAYAPGLTLAAAAPWLVGCDLEPVVERASDEWRALLGADRAALAAALTMVVDEPLAARALRVWSAAEALRKGGLPFDAPLTLAGASGARVDFRSGAWEVRSIRLALAPGARDLVLTVAALAATAVSTAP